MKPVQTAEALCARLSRCHDALRPLGPLFPSSEIDELASAKHDHILWLYCEQLRHPEVFEGLSLLALLARVDGLAWTQELNRIWPSNFNRWEWIDEAVRPRVAGQDAPHYIIGIDYAVATNNDIAVLTDYMTSTNQENCAATQDVYSSIDSTYSQNQKDRDADVIELLDDVHLFTCSAESRLAVLRFVRPELRDKWIDKTFKLPFGLITLRATDTFEQENKKAGLDAPAIALLYPIHLLGKPDLPFNDVHAIADAISGGLPILDIVPMEATGARALDTHEWKIVLNSMDPPPGMEKLRFLTVQQGERKFTMGVHQPRLAGRHPCSVCLGIGHYRNQCKHKGNADKLAEIRPQFEREIAIAATNQYELEPAATTLEEHMLQMDRVRLALAPELAALEAAAKAKEAEEVAAAAAKAAAAAAELAAAADAAIAEAIAAAKLEAEVAAQKAKQERKKKKKIKGQQAKKSQSPAVKLGAVLVGKSSGSSPKASGKSKAASATNGVTKNGAARPRVTATPKEERWSHVTGHYHHADGKTPGVKRLWSEREQGTQQAAAAFAGKTADISMEETEDEEEHENPPARVTKLMADANGVRVAVRGQPVVGRHGPQQSTVTKYFQREATVDTRAATEEGEVSVVAIRAPTAPSETLCAVMNGVGMIIVATPGNGSCLFHAITAAQSRRCGLTINAKNATEIAVTMQLRVSLYAQLRQLLRELLSTGSLDLRTMVSMYLTDVPADTTDEQKVTLLLQHFLAAEQQPTLQVPRAFWGGEVEITVFVHWAEEPMYVVDAVRGGVPGIQRYVKIDITQDDGSTATKVVQEMISVAKFAAHIEVYKRQRVIPLVLICNHAWNAGVNCSHFTAARLPNSVYKAWVGSDDLIVEMKRRLNRVVAIIANMEETGIEELQPRISTPPDSSSVYEPSGTISSTGTDDSELTGSQEPEHDARTSCSVDLAQSMPSFELLPEAAWESFRASTTPPMQNPEQGDEDMDDGDAPLSPMEAASQHRLSSILSTPPDPGLSYNAIEKLMPISPAPAVGLFDDKAEAKLLAEFKNAKITTPEALATLHKVNEANAAAFRHWMDKQVKTYPKTYALVKRETTAVAVCDVAKDQPDVIRSLLRSVPFPEIVVAQLPAATLPHAGRVIIWMARVQMLFRLQASLPAKAAKFCRTWATAIMAKKDLASRWALCRDSGKWSKLQAIAEHHKIALPLREQPGLDNKEWTTLVAFLLLVPGCVPVYFQAAGFPMQCDALIAWASRDENIAVFNATATAVRNREWAEATDVLQHWEHQGPTLSVAAAISNPGSTGAVAARS